MSEDLENKSRDRWEERRKRWDDRRMRWEQRREGRRGQGHVWTGVFILLIGVAALVKASVTDLPDWVFSWQMFLIVLGFFLGLKHGFKGGAWFILIIVGGAFLVRDIYPDLEIRRYIWPIVLMFVGAMLIFRPRGRSYRCRDGQKKNPSSGIEEATLVDESHDIKDDYVDSTSFFGGTKKNIISKNFKGGDLVSIFGGTELDLTRADFNGTATLDLTTIFGGTKLIVPSNWTIKSEVVTIFGGMEDKRNMQAVTDNSEKILVLDGTVIFGGIEIKSY
ncbi:MAG: LiaF domain-containing protein [Chitinophagaceae bacterium]